MVRRTGRRCAYLRDEWMGEKFHYVSCIAIKASIYPLKRKQLHKYYDSIILLFYYSTTLLLYYSTESILMTVPTQSLNSTIFCPGKRTSTKGANVEFLSTFQPTQQNTRQHNTTYKHKHKHKHTTLCLVFKLPPLVLNYFFPFLHYSLSIIIAILPILTRVWSVTEDFGPTKP